MLFKVAEATVKAMLRSSYANHYRSRLIKLLSVLEFCSNNTMHRPVLDALELIGKYAGREPALLPARRASVGRSAVDRHRRGGRSAHREQ
ncbi:hypothetical protein IU468_25425 [Nocardia farcinica]|nr:hypothetical protein [Nocardia farcinica]